MSNSTIEVIKVNDEQQIAYGFAWVSEDDDGLVYDTDNEAVETTDLEKAAYDYVLEKRDSGIMHENGELAGRIVESMVFTPDKLEALDLDSDAVPYAWWVGIKVFDSDTFQKVKDKELGMFSIQGKAVRVPVSKRNKREMYDMQKGKCSVCKEKMSYGNARMKDGKAVCKGCMDKSADGGIVKNLKIDVDTSIDPNAAADALVKALQAKGITGNAAQ